MRSEAVCPAKTSPAKEYYPNTPRASIVSLPEYIHSIHKKQLQQNVQTMKPFLLTLLFACLSIHGLGDNTDTPKKEFKHPDRISYDGACLKIDGKDRFIYSAAFHYFRCPEELWRDRFRKIKEAGFNTVETYVPWNWHERTMPSSIDDTTHFDFSDLKRWLHIAQNEFNLYTIVRPGPFICAEFSGGAYPRWLAKFRPADVKGLWLRSADPTHIRWSEHWFKGVCKALANEQITRKKKGEKGIILIQIENEYNAHGCNNKEDFLKSLYRTVRNSGFDIPVFTCLTNECRGSKDKELSQVFDCDNYYVGLSDAPSCAFRMSSLKQKQPDAPGFVTELQGGWFSLVTGSLSEEHYSDARHFKAIGLMTLLGGGTGINYYMLTGGTHLAGWGARGMTTSYDYNAAIHENGSVGEKYLEAKGIGDFIRHFEPQLVRTQGGPCELKGAPKELFGGVRVSNDGTLFVFLHNTHPQQRIKGTVTVVPDKVSLPQKDMYNIDQNGNKVLMQVNNSQRQADSLYLSPIEVKYDLEGLDTRVLVIKPGQKASSGEWWPKKQKGIRRPGKLPEAIRIASVKRKEDNYDQAQWLPMSRLASLSDLDINDFRYSLYRSKVHLTKSQAEKEKFLLFNMFTRDIVSVRVNGKNVKRLFPEKADAQTWLTRNCFDRIRPDEFDNRFDVSGTLKEGDNEILVVYENLGHAHGYVPMEELSGIREAGLSVTETALTHPLQWEFSADAAGVTENWTQPDFNADGWEVIPLDTQSEIQRKGNNIQPRKSQDGLFTWYRMEFTLPAGKKNEWIPWLLRINASGNGYMWLNGHNIGRHWEAGPQREFYLPECWLKFGGTKNVLTIGLRQTENGAYIQSAEIRPDANGAETR